MKLCIFLCFVFAINVVFGQWANRVHLEDFQSYFLNAMREVVHDLEKRGFSNLKLHDQQYTINEQMYRWLVSGNITYTNGFLVSIQKIDVTNIQQQTSGSTSADGVTQTVSSVHGRLNLRDMKIGYDVIAELGADGDHRFTGTFIHSLLSYHIYIRKILETNEISVSSSVDSFVSNALDRMQFLPANNITQVISRTYIARNVWNSVADWNTDVILPILLDVAQNKIAFPPVCLDCR